MLTSIKFRGHALSCGTIDWLKILSDDHTRAMYNKHLLMLMTEPTQWDDHQELILQAGALTATTHKCQYESWFQISRSALAPLYIPSATPSNMQSSMRAISPPQSKPRCNSTSSNVPATSPTQCTMPRQHGMQTSARRSMTCGLTHA